MMKMKRVMYVLLALLIVCVVVLVNHAPVAARPFIIHQPKIWDGGLFDFEEEEEEQRAREEAAREEAARAEAAERQRLEQERLEQERRDQEQEDRIFKHLEDRLKALEEQILQLESLMSAAIAAPPEENASDGADWATFIDISDVYANGWQFNTDAFMVADEFWGSGFTAALLENNGSEVNWCPPYDPPLPRCPCCGGWLINHVQSVQLDYQFEIPMEYLTSNLDNIGFGLDYSPLDYFPDDVLNDFDFLPPF